LRRAPVSIEVLTAVSGRSPCSHGPMNIDTQPLISTVLFLSHVLASIVHFSLVITVFCGASQDSDSISLCFRCELPQDEFEISRQSDLRMLEVMWEGEAFVNLSFCLLYIIQAFPLVVFSLFSCAHSHSFSISRFSRSSLLNYLHL
jgi:hypothetical protein